MSYRMLLLINLFPLHFLFSQNNDTIFLEKTDANSIYIESNKNAVLPSILRSVKNEDGYSSIQMYKGKYYLYVPCDWMWHNRIKIHKDSVEINMGETDSFKIEKRKKKNKKQTIFYSLQNPSNFKANLSIRTINEKEGIVIIRFNYIENPEFYFLAVDNSKIDNYPIIVNECPYFKSKEFSFDELDLKEMFNE